MLAAVAASPLAAQEIDEVLRFESGTVVELGTGADRGYSILTGDGRRSGWRSRDSLVRLRWAQFDPSVRSPVADWLPESGRLRVVQFETQILEEYVHALRGLGVDVVRVVPAQSVVANVPPHVERRLAALDFVRWVGPFPAEARLHPAMVSRLRDASAGAEDYVIQVAHRGMPDKRRVVRAVRRFGGRVDEPLSPHGFLLEATLTPAQVARVAALDGVVWIDPATEPSLALDNVRSDSGANYVEQLTGFTGAGVRAELMDSGFSRNHPEFRSNPPIMHTQNGRRSIAHGTGTYGILFSDGVNSPAARGMLPDAQGIFASIFHSEDRYRHTAELVADPYRAVFQSNSWGNGPNGLGYTGRSFQLDDILHLYDLVTCQAFGNTGSTVAMEEAWSKNTVTVGGIRHQNTLTTTDDRWFNASIGPASDGRIKPDVAYWSDNILTTAPQVTYTRTFGGTSAATPQVAGVFGLLFQMWHEEVFGNVALGSDVFDSRPHAATARALVCNTTNPYPFQGTAANLTRTHQGWGRPHAGNLLDLGRRVLVVDEWRPLRNLEVARYAVGVGDAARSCARPWCSPTSPGPRPERRCESTT